MGFTEKFDTPSERDAEFNTAFAEIKDRFGTLRDVKIQYIQSTVGFIVQMYPGMNADIQKLIDTVLGSIKKFNIGDNISDDEYLKRLDTLYDNISVIKQNIEDQIFSDISGLSLNSTSTTEPPKTEETPEKDVAESITPEVPKQESGWVSNIAGGAVENESTLPETTTPEVPEVTPVAPTGTPETATPTKATETVSVTAFEEVTTSLTQFQLYLDTLKSQYTGADSETIGHISLFVTGLIAEVGPNFPQKMAYPEFADRFTADIEILKSITGQIQKEVRFSEIEVEGKSGSEIGEILKNKAEKRTEIGTETEAKLKEAKGDIYNSLGDLLVEFEDGTMMRIEDPVLIEYLKIIKSIEGNTDHKSIINEGQGLELPETGMSILSRVSIGSEKFLDNVEYSDEDFNILIDRMLNTDDGFYKLLAQRYSTKDKEIIRNKFRGELQLQTPQTVNEGEVLKTAESVLRNNFTQLQGQLGDGGTMMVLNGKNIGPFSNTLERDQNILQILYFYKGLLEDPNQLRSFGGGILKITNFILRLKGLGIPWALEKLVGFTGSDSLESILAALISGSAIGMVGLGFYSKRMRIIGTSREPGRMLEGMGANRRLVIAPVRISRIAESALLPRGTESGLLQKYKDLLKKDKNPDGSMTDEVKTGLQALEEEFKKFKTGTNLEDLVKRDTIFANLLELHKNDPKIVTQIQELYNNIRLYKNKNVFYSTLFTEYQSIIGERSTKFNIARSASNFFLTGFIETLEARKGGQINIAWVREKFQNGNPLILRSEKTYPGYTIPARTIPARTIPARTIPAIIVAGITIRPERIIPEEIIPEKIIKPEQIVTEKTKGEISIQRGVFQGSFEKYFDKITSQGFLISIDNSKIIDAGLKTDIRDAVKVESEKPAGGMQLQEIRSAFEGINEQLKGIQDKIMSTDGNPISTIFIDEFKKKIDDELKVTITNNKTSGLSKGRLGDLKKAVTELAGEIPDIEKIYGSLKGAEYDYIKAALEPKIKGLIAVSGDSKIKEYSQFLSPDTGKGLVIEIHERYHGDDFFKGELARILSAGNDMQESLENLKDTGGLLDGLFQKFRGLNGGTELTLDQKRSLFDKKFSIDDIKHLNELFDNTNYNSIERFALNSSGDIDIGFLDKFLSHYKKVSSIDASKLPKGSSKFDEEARIRDEFIKNITSSASTTPIAPVVTPPTRPAPDHAQVAPESKETDIDIRSLTLDYLRRYEMELNISSISGFNISHYMGRALRATHYETFVTEMQIALEQKFGKKIEVRNWEDIIRDPKLDYTRLSKNYSITPEIAAKINEIRAITGDIEIETRLRFRDLIVRAIKTGG